MIVIETDNTIFYDVDETLVLHDFPIELLDQTVLFNHFGYPRRLLPHYKMIENLVINKTKKKHITIWSQNGWEWAKEVVTKLGLEDYVDEVRCKPELIFDDLLPSEFLTRVYIKPNFQGQ